MCGNSGSGPMCCGQQGFPEGPVSHRYRNCGQSPRWLCRLCPCAGHLAVGMSQGCAHQPSLDTELHLPPSANVTKALYGPAASQPWDSPMGPRREVLERMERGRAAFGGGQGEDQGHLLNNISLSQHRVIHLFHRNACGLKMKGCFLY